MLEFFIEEKDRSTRLGERDFGVLSRLIPKLQRLIGECKGGNGGQVKLVRGKEVGKGKKRLLKEGEVGEEGQG